MKTIISSFSYMLLILATLVANNANAVTYTNATTYTPGITAINANYPTYTITSSIDYGTVNPSLSSYAHSVVQPDITIVNTGTSVLQIGNIADTDPVAAPFAIYANPCVNALIQPGDQCSFEVQFSPTQSGSFNNSLNIDIQSDGSTHTVSLSGVGGSPSDASDIDIFQTSINFHQVDVLNATTATTSPYGFTEYVKNDGALDLNLKTITVGGNDASDVSYSGVCAPGLKLSAVTSTNSSGGYCSLHIEFAPTTPGIKTANISITSDDPDESPFIINIIGQAIGENDGVPASVEDAAPNNGDGNNDGILDSTQNDVASLVDAQGNYVTFQTTQGLRFTNMMLSQNNTSGMPGILVNGPGQFSFSINGLTQLGQTAQVGIILPAGIVPSALYLYGPTTSNTTPHWYQFTNDTASGTGVSILGNTTFTNGAGMTRSVVMATFQDGGPGDSDMKANGVITVDLALAPPSSSSSSRIGSLGILQLLFVFLVLTAARFRIFNYPAKKKY